MERKKTGFLQNIWGNRALQFIILMGIISLLADMTYEGARSITGQYLAILGASAALVGLVAGLGELLGYSLRLLSGYLADKTHRYWALTIIGYSVNLLAVPLLAIAGNWPLAATLLVLERIGKALRTPPRDVMLSHATSQVGRGLGFALHEAMDQIGAILGPLIVAAVLYTHGNYQAGFLFLLIPALLALMVLAVSRYLYPHPHKLEIKRPHLESKGFQRYYWVYLAGAALLALGFADFPLIAYHFQGAMVLTPAIIPILYSVAMGVDALSALIFGRFFDKIGMPVMALSTLISAFFAPFVFLGGEWMALMGMVLWGVGMGAQESVMRAAVANLTPIKRRGVAYGLLNTIFGVFWFAGSLFMGILYDFNPLYLVIFSLTAQLGAVPIFLFIHQEG